MKKNILIYILLLAFILRFLGVFQSFWLDEATTGVVVSDLNFKEIIFDFARSDFHPPLYYLIVKFWSLLFGTTEVSLRFVSIIFSLLTIVYLYKLGKIMFNETVGIVSALFLSIAPLHIYYSHEARMYSMAAFLATISIFYFFKVLKNKKNKAISFFAYSFFISILYLVDYVSIFIVIPMFLIFVFSKKKSYKQKFIFCISHFTLLAVFLIWFPVLKNQFNNGVQVEISNPVWWKTLGEISIKNILLIPVKFFIGRINWSNKIVYTFFVFLVSSIYLYNLKNAFDKKSKNLFFIIMISFFIGLFVSLKIPIFLYFRFLFLLPLLYLLIAYGLLKQKENIFMIFFSLIVLLNFYFSLKYLLIYQYHREDWRYAASFIRNFQTENNLVIWLSTSQQEALKYYNVADDVKYISDVNDITNKILLSRYVHDIVDPDNHIQKKIEESFDKVGEYNFNGIIFFEYNKKYEENSN